MKVFAAIIGLSVGVLILALCVQRSVRTARKKRDTATAALVEALRGRREALERAQIAERQLRPVLARLAAFELARPAIDSLIQAGQALLREPFSKTAAASLRAAATNVELQLEAIASPTAASGPAIRRGAATAPLHDTSSVGPVA